MQLTHLLAPPVWLAIANLEHRPDQCQRRDGGGIGAQDAGSSASRTVFGELEQRSRSSAAKPPSGPTRTRSGIGPVPPAGRAADSACIGSLTSASSSQKTRRRAHRARRSFARRSAVRRSPERQDAALFGSFDGVGAHAVEIDARDLGVPVITGCGRDAPSRRPSAPCNRGGHAERREQVMQIECAGLGPRALGDVDRDCAFSRACQRASPFPVAAVENQHGIAGFEAQHIAEVVRLRRIRRESPASREHRCTGGACGNRSGAWFPALVVPSSVF